MTGVQSDARPSGGIETGENREVLNDKFGRSLWSFEEST